LGYYEAGQEITILWVKKITRTQFFVENESPNISCKKDAAFRFKNV
jgi:hypothetical protein